LTGVVASRQEIQAEAGALQAALAHFQAEKPAQFLQLVARLSERQTHRHALLTVLGRAFYQWRYRRQLRRELWRLEQLETSQRQQLESLLARKRELDRQIEMLDAARRLLRYWHIFHVPLGLTLFFSVAIHIVATTYFRAGLFN
jgi:exonuclease VII large subunit